MQHVYIRSSESNEKFNGFCWLKRILLDIAATNMSFIRISWIYCLCIYSVSTCVDIMEKNSIPIFSKFGTCSAINEKSKFLETSFNFWALVEKTRKKKYKSLILMSALGILTRIKNIQRMKQFLVVSNRAKKILPNFLLNTFF